MQNGNSGESAILVSGWHLLVLSQCFSVLEVSFGFYNLSVPSVLLNDLEASPGFLLESLLLNSRFSAARRVQVCKGQRIHMTS